jgi:hypothetical protein
MSFQASLDNLHVAVAIDPEFESKKTCAADIALQSVQ